MDGRIWADNIPSLISHWAMAGTPEGDVESSVQELRQAQRKHADSVKELNGN